MEPQGPTGPVGPARESIPGPSSSQLSSAQLSIALKKLVNLEHFCQAI